MSLNNANISSHTKRNCKRHIAFAPKYRLDVFYHEKRKAAGKTLVRMCEWKGMQIAEAEVRLGYGLPERKEQYNDV